MTMMRLAMVDFAIGERIQRIDQLARRSRPPDALTSISTSSEVKSLTLLTLILPLRDGVLDRGDQRIGRGRRRNFFDDDRRLVLDFDLRADLDRCLCRPCIRARPSGRRSGNPAGT